MVVNLFNKFNITTSHKTSDYQSTHSYQFVKHNTLCYTKYILISNYLNNNVIYKINNLFERK